MEIRQKCAILEEPQFVPGIYNPSDIGTREGVIVSALSEGSLWQQGPPFLMKPRKEWPLLGVKCGEVPEEELRGKYVELHQTVSECMLTEIRPYDHILHLARHSVLRAGSWARAQGVLARLLRAMFSQKREDVLINPSPRERLAAKALQIVAHSESARKAMAKGSLLSLGPTHLNGMVVITGRVRKEVLAEILGTRVLPVIMSCEPLAWTIMKDAHEEDHNRDSSYILARARKHSWIPGGARLAKSVAKACMWCRKQAKKMMTQVMADLPSDHLAASAPFQIASLDMFGPFWAKDVAKSRRAFKCWGVLYFCLNTKAVAIFASPGYSTGVFIETHKKFTAIYTPGSAPSRIYSDHGTQLVAAATSIDWEQVKCTAGWTCTEWVFTPKSCSWRNGACERAIRSARNTLAHSVTFGVRLNYQELEAAFFQAAAIINSRPLAIKMTGDDVFHAITPSDLLLGRAGHAVVDPEGLELFDEADRSVVRSSQRLQQVVQLWWKSWIRQAFPEMVPRTKWKLSQRNVEIGDICFMTYHTKLGPPVFRLCRILRTFPDIHSKIRTCEVQLGCKDILKTYVVKEPVKMITAVQRLSVLLPKQEQN